MLSVRARRLVVLLAALTALVAAASAGLVIAPAAHASDAQNRVRAFTPAARTLAPLPAAESACSHQGSIGSGEQIAPGFCVATEDGGSGEPSIHSTLRGGERGIEPSEVTQNGDLYFDSGSGNKVYVLGTWGRRKRGCDSEP
jgi:hypothetical protein